ncbi:hypothetical protein MC885_013658 [Smutsia gigantea]|nr:hypothetical protein MC885_013658 [Smutsia gigantea]
MGKGDPGRCLPPFPPIPVDGLPQTPRKLHSGVKTYGCELCGKRFLDSLRLRMHLLAHSAAREQSWDVLEEMFDSTS